MATKWDLLFILVRLIPLWWSCDTKWNDAPKWTAAIDTSIFRQCVFKYVYFIVSFVLSFSTSFILSSSHSHSHFHSHWHFDIKISIGELPQRKVVTFFRLNILFPRLETLHALCVSLIWTIIHSQSNLFQRFLLQWLFCVFSSLSVSFFRLTLWNKCSLISFTCLHSLEWDFKSYRVFKCDKSMCHFYHHQIFKRNNSWSVFTSLCHIFSQRILVIVIVTEHNDICTTGSYIVVNDNGTIAMNETIAWTNLSNQLLVQIKYYNHTLYAPWDFVSDFVFLFVFGCFLDFFCFVFNTKWNLCCCGCY
jgi:hypothetical protein